MKIAHIISSIDQESGGTSKYLQSLISKCHHMGVHSIFTLNSKTPLDFPKNVNIKFFDNSKSLYHKLLKEDQYIYHGNGLWQLPTHYMSKIARKRNCPYIISPHGMLEPWSLFQSSLKKKIALALYQRKDLEKAACIHATSKMEANNIRRLGFKNPIAVIPNGINLDEYPLKDFSIKRQNKKKLLFLSRIHPKKGIEILIKAWEKLDYSLRINWEIDIAGNGEKKYINTLNQLISNKGLESEIKIIGSKFGQEKLNTYHSSDLFVLPTYSENFGIVIGEALSCGIPVITTNGTPWQELNVSNSGWCIDIGVESLIKVLNKALILNDNQLQEMGQNGRKLIENEYSITSVSNKMSYLYQWLLESTNKPDFVDIVNNE